MVIEIVSAIGVSGLVAGGLIALVMTLKGRLASGIVSAVTGSPEVEADPLREQRVQDQSQTMADNALSARLNRKRMQLASDIADIKIVQAGDPEGAAILAQQLSERSQNQARAAILHDKNMSKITRASDRYDATTDVNHAEELTEVTQQGEGDAVGGSGTGTGAGSGNGK